MIPDTSEAVLHLDDFVNCFTIKKLFILATTSDLLSVGRWYTPQGLKKMFNLQVVFNSLKLWDALCKVIWNLIWQFFFSSTCVFLACNWLVAWKCCIYHCYRVPPKHQVLQAILCCLIVAVSLVVVDAEVKLLLKEIFFSHYLFFLVSAWKNLCEYTGFWCDFSSFR